MGANAPSKGLPWIAALFAAALLALLFASRGQRSPEGEAQATPPAEPPAAGEPPPRAGLLPAAPAPATPEQGRDSQGAIAEAAEPPLADTDSAEYPLDLESLRAQLPDNLYWKLGAPTEDPAVLQMRAEDKLRWNELLGKVQSNTASEEEIRSYYDHRREVSEDYLEFATVVLEEHGDKLPERDRGLYELSAKMHRSRLAEIPCQIDDALARKRDHDQRREAWRQREGGE